MQLTGKIYCYPWKGNGNNCNTYLYAGTKTLLIDPGHIRNEFRVHCLEMLLKAMAADGFTPDRLDLILCTHSHPDHCEAAAELQEKYSLSVAMHRNEETYMANLSRYFERMTGARARLPRIDIYLQEGELELGTEETEQVQLLLTPGHSPGSLSFYFPGEQALVTGDAVFYGSIGRTDFPGGSLQVLGESVDKLAALTDVEWLLPGHMQIVRGREQVKNNYRMVKQMFFY
ncbi:MAG: MBL fold metallo-hydrolase [Bacillota bacterium]